VSEIFWGAFSVLAAAQPFGLAINRLRIESHFYFALFAAWLNSLMFELCMPMPFRYSSSLQMR
jgi:hypothetical protein